MNIHRFALLAVLVVFLIVPLRAENPPDASSKSKTLEERVEKIETRLKDIVSSSKPGSPFSSKSQAPKKEHSDSSAKS